MSARVTRVEVESSGAGTKVHVTVDQHGLSADKVPVPEEFRKAILRHFTEDES